MKKIEPQPTSSDAKNTLEWLCKGDYHGLDESGLTDIIRLLITRINQLSDEVDYLRNRVNQHDNLL